ncbi:hypothetical protein Poli38472_009525 [Pythium oligandrum]|uniref:snRNA-activating protein complex subunit 3 n=1 Tax=Pythium oligandrum TaxID=41045 RepID=A0A8K1CEV6_PYTOL|nr:hypothetical protein Poli38472_009525 [Pythium oligandrum]|eukprot:TMW62032.1 hypothetical protein Poli38472_009525 [Pythium oligandrum]
MTPTSDFAALFPPLVGVERSSEEQEMESTHGAVDVDVSDIALPPLEQEIESHVYEALRRWNELEPAKSETTMSYMDRLRRYRAIIRWVHYETEDDENATTTEEVADDAEVAKQRKKNRKERVRRQREITRYRELFASLPSIQALREKRRPSERLEAFQATYPAKKLQVLQKRSLGETQTSLCFEFARKRPQLALHPRANDKETEEEAEPAIAAPTATTAATWRTRTLLASAQHARTTDDAVAKLDDLVLWIEVLHPSKDPARTQSFLVRSSQKLSDLVDLLVCAYDQRLETHGRRSKLVYFDRKFYVDRRPEDHLDYSKAILDWINAKPSRQAKYLHSSEANPVFALEDTRFADLALKIDVPGVYIHQGECEHLIRLRDVRLPHGFDSTQLEDFPMRLPNMLYRQLRNCLICQQYSAKFVCYGDRLSISDPMFFCERCYRTAHYDPNGQLLYSDFQAFPFVQE